MPGYARKVLPVILAGLAIASAACTAGETGKRDPSPAPTPASAPAEVRELPPARPDPEPLARPTATAQSAEPDPIPPRPTVYTVEPGDTATGVAA